MSEQKMREAFEAWWRAAVNDPYRAVGIADEHVAWIAWKAARDQRFGQPEAVELTDEEMIKFALDSGFERNTLGWSFTYGRLDYHLLKFARGVIAAHEAKKGGAT